MKRHPHLRFALPALLVVAFLLVLSGCAAAPALNRAAWTPNRQVAAPVAPFWKMYPPSAFGLEVIPDQPLGRGTPVRLLGHRLGFSEIQLSTLERGWVPRGTLSR